MSASENTAGSRKTASTPSPRNGRLLLMRNSNVITLAYSNYDINSGAQTGAAVRCLLMSVQQSTGGMTVE